MKNIRVSLLKIEEVSYSQQFQALAALEAACFPANPWQEDELKAFLQAPIRRAFFLEENAPIGYIILTLFGTEAEIERLGVLPDWRGAKRGRYMLERVLQMLQAERCVLEVSANNKAALRLYESIGFDIFGKRSSYYHDGADALMMEWKRKDE